MVIFMAPPMSVYLTHSIPISDRVKRLYTYTLLPGEGISWQRVAKQRTGRTDLGQPGSAESEVGKPEIQIGPVHAAVDLEHLAGDVAGGRRRQEEDRGRHILRIADPAELDRPLHLAAQRVVGEHDVQRRGGRRP